MNDKGSVNDNKIVEVSPSMRYYPIFVDMKNAKILVFGNNESALQKIRLLLKTPAQITVFHSLKADQSQCLMSVLKNEFSSARLSQLRPISINSFNNVEVQDFHMVYQTNDDENYSPEEYQFIEDWLKKSRQAKVFINSVDVPEECDFITPSIVDRAPLTIAIGTEGIAPTLGQMVKTKLETWLPNNLSDYLQHAKSLRPRVLKSLPLSRDRRVFWRAFFDDYLRELFFRNKPQFDTKIDELIKQQITSSSSKDKLSDKAISSQAVSNENADTEALMTADLKKDTFDKTSTKDNRPSEYIGRVSFVGAGPGDPELLTLKAVQKLQNADVIIYDRLINQDILEYARRDAIRINVGKKPGDDGTNQNDINTLLVDQAKHHKFIVRLKGGDPLIFGRISEEIQTLNNHNIGYDIVPGITSATGCAANSNMPLTNRESHHGLIILSGHSQFGMPEYDWQSLVKIKVPIVFYMGVRNASSISENLVAAGLDLSTAVTIIENGLHEDEKVIISNLGNYIEAMNYHNIKGPALIYIGLKPLDNSFDLDETNDSNKLTNVNIYTDEIKTKSSSSSLLANTELESVLERLKHQSKRIRTEENHLG